MAAVPEVPLSASSSGPGSQESTDLTDTGDFRVPGLASPVPDQLASRYEVGRTLGSGSFSTVYLGRDPELNRRVAVKIPRPMLLQGVDRKSWFEEARIAAQLEHPTIVSVYDVGLVGEETYFIVSQHIDGETLAERLRRGRLEVPEALSIVTRIAEALQFAHLAGVVHRDVKPSNILLDKRGNAYLTDFGLALRASQCKATRRWIGTARYMSPEQARGESDQVDGRSDIFSLGVVLFEMLTGSSLYEGTDFHAVADEILSKEAPSPRALDRRVPADLDRVCRRALAVSLGRRYRTAAEMLNDLRVCEARIADPRRLRGPLRQPAVTAGVVSCSVLAVWMGVQAGLSGSALGLDEQRPVAVAPADVPVPQAQLPVVAPLVGPQAFAPKPAAREDASPAAVWVTTVGGTFEAGVSGVLQRIDVGEIGTVDDGELVVLAKLEHLQHLALDSTSVTDDGLPHLAGLTTLQSLWLNKLPISDEGFRHLADLRRMRHLDLTGTVVGDDTLAIIGQWDALEFLSLGGTDISDAGLRHLGNAPNLKVLHLHQTPVTDEGLISLRGLPKLRELDLTGCAVTEDGISRLLATLPEQCRIID